MDTQNQPTQLQRRGFFQWISGILAAIAAALAGVPLVAYVVVPRKGKVHWVSLGPVEQFAVDQTRLMEFDNPLRQPWDGIVARTGVYVRNEGGREEPLPSIVSSC